MVRNPLTLDVPGCFLGEDILGGREPLHGFLSFCSLQIHTPHDLPVSCSLLAVTTLVCLTALHSGLHLTALPALDTQTDSCFSDNQCFCNVLSKPAVLPQVILGSGFAGVFLALGRKDPSLGRLALDESAMKGGRGATCSLSRSLFHGCR